MRAVVQRVLESDVKVDGKTIGQIGRGLLILLAVEKNDSQEDLEYIYDKLVNLRIFEDEHGKMNRSLKDERAELLLVSQFTLYGDVRKGRRPSFSDSAAPDLAMEFYQGFIDMARNDNIYIETGEFGADMKLSIVNDGPVTILLDSNRVF